MMNNGILKGIRVLDFTRVLAGPFATRLLADFGAEVIKVQSKKTATGAEANDRGYFNTWNRNKKSITLDMDCKEAREIALRLAGICDIVIENFSPRVMANLGLDYEKLIEIKPDIIMISMSAMGHTGPWKDYVGFGPTVQSFGGLTSLASFSEATPLGLGYSYADPVVGLYGAFAVLAALEYRDRTGTGQYIDLSGYEAVCTSIAPVLMDVSVNNTNAIPEGNKPVSVPAAPYGCYQCRGEDRWCVIAIYNENEWAALSDAMGHPELIEEDRFIDIAKRRKNAEELDSLIESWTSGSTPEEVVEMLQQKGVAAAIVKNAEDLANDKHLLDRNFFVHLEHPLFGNTVSDRTPIRLGDNRPEDWKCAPQMGEHNRYVYMELLGLSELQLTTYIKEGIIG